MRYDHRIQHIRDFIDTTDWQGVAFTPMPQDASSRLYYRLQGGPSAVLLMDAPPSDGKDVVKSFSDIATYLRQIGLSSPEIMAADFDQGLLLIEDFGEDTFTRLLDQGQDPFPLYELAIDALLHLQSNKSHLNLSCDKHGAEEMRQRLDLVPKWYYQLKHQSVCPIEVQESFDVAWASVLAPLDDLPQTLQLRDFHVDNAMLLPQRLGVGACGLLDFQDAAIGPAAFDVVSLIEDARRDVSDDLRRHCWLRYLEAHNELEQKQLRASYAILAAQRHARIVGIFSRLALRDNKDHYLIHLPRVEAYFKYHLETEMALKPVCKWFKRFIPQLFQG